MSFSHWYNNVADMPQKGDDGEWFDAETGFSYASYVAQNSKKIKSTDSKTLENRSIAKKFGGKALMGSAAQKKWAEKLRADVLTKLSSDESELVLTCTLLNSAKFWIENRQKTARDILDFVITQKSLKARYDEAKSNGDDVNVSNFANDYNKLTEKWGFA